MPAFLRSKFHDSRPNKDFIVFPGEEMKYEHVEDVRTGRQSVIVVGCLPYDNVTVIFEGSPDLLDDAIPDISKFKVVKRLMNQGRYERTLGDNGAAIGMFTVSHSDILAPSRYEPPQARHDWPLLIECARDNIQPLL